MCKYTNDCRKRGSRLVCAISILLFGLGVATGILGAFAMGLIDNPDQFADGNFLGKIDVGQ